MGFIKQDAVPRETGGSADVGTLNQTGAAVTNGWTDAGRGGETESVCHGSGAGRRPEAGGVRLRDPGEAPPRHAPPRPWHAAVLKQPPLAVAFQALAGRCCGFIPVIIRKQPGPRAQAGAGAVSPGAAGASLGPAHSHFRSPAPEPPPRQRGGSRPSGAGLRVGGYKSRSRGRRSHSARRQRAWDDPAAMDPRLALLLALLAGAPRTSRALEGGGLSKETPAEEPAGYLERLRDGLQESEDRASWPAPAERPPGPLLRSLLQALQRPARSPSFLFQPQRFGRETRGSWGSEGRLSQRGWDSTAAQFWSMAVPQRFGRKK
ncbi:pro-FMRFamide-related neuropeptide FF [Pelodiscus sinensis]|uniref:pro-FMRFamide-related neuropeptide FF n=1 Tax=Pelodiscus sinensis TaxID=13735 RepID=UPI003F6AAA46